MSESIREKQKSINTLACLLQALQGYNTVVELRNETSVRGQILDVDCYMNMNMSNVELTNQKGEKTNFSDFFVQGKQIRFAHIPPEIDIMDAIQRQLDYIEGKNAYNTKFRKPKFIGGKKYITGQRKVLEEADKVTEPM